MASPFPKRRRLESVPPSNDSPGSLPSVVEPSTPMNVNETSAPLMTDPDSECEMDSGVEEVTQEEQYEARENDDNGPRDERDLEKHGFRPVWTSWDRYPGEMPDDIKEFLDENGRRDSAQLIGPLSSLVWLEGYDELVAMIDHPAYVLSDDIYVIPHGASISWLVDRLFQERLIPREIFRRLPGT